MNPAPEPGGREWEGRWRLLGDRCVFRVAGPDRVRYLNGQVTNDVSRLAPGESLAACLCSIKGKVEALVWIHAEEDALVVDGEARQREAIGARLNRYLVADDCEVEDVSEEVAILHHFDSARGGLRSRRLDREGWDLFLPAGAGIPFAAETAILDHEWELGEIRARLPRSGREITGDEFPAELGLDAWAVDFHKGCYLGQEIVSRLHSVGRVKRELAAIVSPEPLAPGDQVKDSCGNQGRSTRGTQSSGEKNFQGLALFEKRGGEGVSFGNQRVVKKLDSPSQSQ
jgi:folate-binding protein YgfZ